MRLPRNLALLCLAAVTALPSCGGDSGPVDPNGGGGNGGGGTGTVAGVVTVDGTTTEISGVSVEVGGQSYTTGEDGRFSIASVPTGNQTLTASKSDFEPYSVSVWVTENQTTVHDVAMVASIPTATVDGQVRDVRTSASLPGVEVSVAGLTDTTDANGNYQLTSVPQGEQQITADREDYFRFQDVIRSPPLTSAGRTFDIEMTPKVPVIEAASVSVVLRDATDAQVTWDGEFFVRLVADHPDREALPLIVEVYQLTNAIDVGCHPEGTTEQVFRFGPPQINSGWLDYVDQFSVYSGSACNVTPGASMYVLDEGDPSYQPVEFRSPFRVRACWPTYDGPYCSERDFDWEPPSP